MTEDPSSQNTEKEGMMRMVHQRSEVLIFYAQIDKG